VKKTRQIVVTKSDGTLERFSLAKLSNCLTAAVRELAYDPRLAQPLGRAVAMHLQEWSEANPPTTGYIYRCLRSVLQQTGLSDVADALAEHRRQRRMRRRRIRVLDLDPMSAGSEAWRKSAIVETLRNEFGLRHAVARFMAGRIEDQVFALDYRVISRPFIWEMLRNEVLAWGLADVHVLRAIAHNPSPPVVTRPPEKET